MDSEAQSKSTSEQQAHGADLRKPRPSAASAWVPAVACLTKAPKGRAKNWKAASIPDVALVDGDSVPVAKRAKFVLICQSMMVLFLALNISLDFGCLRFADGE